MRGLDPRIHHASHDSFKRMDGRVKPGHDEPNGENGMSVTRREAMAGFAAGAASLMASPATAQAAYPSRTIKLVVPYPAGGTTDLLGRLVADQLKSGLGAT